MKNDFNRPCSEKKIIFGEQNEDHLDFFKSEEEAIIEKNKNKKMEAYFSIKFECVRQERSSFFPHSITDPYILKQSNFTDNETNKKILFMINYTGREF